MEAFESKKVKWLVTGAEGQLGQTFLAELTMRGYEVNSFGSKDLDITDKNRVLDVVTSLAPDVLLNAAAWTDVEGAEINRDKAFSVNKFGVENLVTALSIVNSIFVHISTDYVFSGESKKPWLENSPQFPKSVYGLSKSAGENSIKDIYSEKSYIVRTSWLYSEYGKNFVKTICKISLMSEKEIEVVDDQIGQPTNAHDLSSQIISLVNSNAEYGAYHGTNSGEATWFELAQEIFRLCGENVERVIPITTLNYSSNVIRPKYSVLSHGSWADAQLEPMRPWRESLRSLIPEIIANVKAEG